MASCDPFEIPLPGDIIAAVGRVRAAISEGGGAFEGDEAAGRFTGKTPVGSIEGSYVVQASAIRVTISSKPMLAPCGMIESKIRSYFGT
jgi:hypothetical protein